MKLAKTIVQWNDIKHIRPKDDNFYLVAEEVDLVCVHRKIRTIEMLRPSQFEQHYEKNFYRRTVTHWAELPKPFGHPASTAGWQEFPLVPPPSNDGGFRLLVTLDKRCTVDATTKRRVFVTVRNGNCDLFFPDKKPKTTSKIIAWALMPDLPKIGE